MNYQQQHECRTVEIGDFDALFAALKMPADEAPIEVGLRRILVKMTTRDLPERG